MSILHLMVGLRGSGKTTRVEAIEAQTGALRVVPDERHIRLFGDNCRHPDHDRRHRVVEALMQEVDAAVLRRGDDVILDFGSWPRTDRDKARVARDYDRGPPAVNGGGRVGL